MAEDKLYILPMDNGSTVVVYKDEKQPSFLMWPLEAEKCSSSKEIKELFNLFLDVSRLKVSLFKEMCRSLPAWAQLNYDWLHELIQMSVNGSRLDPNRGLTDPDKEVLHWLLYTMTDPKINFIPKSCHKELLEVAGVASPPPTLAFLLEYKDPLPSGDMLYGFLPASPQDVFSLLYIFPEAGKGCHFSKSLEEAFSAPIQNFTLCGQTDCRVILMMAYVSNPWIERVDELPPEDRSSAINERGFYRMKDTKNARLVALLLYKVTGREETISSQVSFVSFIYRKVFALASLVILVHALYKVKLIKWS